MPHIRFMKLSTVTASNEIDEPNIEVHWQKSGQGKSDCFMNRKEKNTVWQSKLTAAKDKNKARNYQIIPNHFELYFKFCC